MTQAKGRRDSRPAGVRFLQNGLRGYSIVELLIVVSVGLILAAIAVPTYKTTMADMQMNDTVSAISGAVSQTRYAAIMNSQIYTLAFTAPANTYVVTNVTTTTVNPAISLPTTTVAINGGANATYTYTMCPNGIVFGAGGTCVPPPNTVPPVLSASNYGRQVNINVSSVGSVTTTNVR